MENSCVTFGEVDSVDFAIYLNKKAKEKNLSVNVTQIQKWLYVCYGLYFAQTARQLLTERPKAWDYGPAFPKVHRQQKKNNDTLDGLEVEGSLLKKYDDLVELTLNTFGTWSAGQLVQWTHEENTAWDKKIKLGEKYGSLDNYDIMIDFKKYIEDSHSNGNRD